MFKSPVDLPLSRLSLNYRVLEPQDVRKELEEQVNSGERRGGRE